MRFLGANAVVGQSGGPTAAINATLCGVIDGAYKSGKINTLYGMQNGIEGLLSGKLINLNGLFGDDERLNALCLTPACALGSTRYRLERAIDGEEYSRIFHVLARNSIKYFFYIGGNDSMDTVAQLDKYARKHGIDVSVVGIPKTIDNDLVKTDHTPGYGSCAKFIGATACELAYDLSIYKRPQVTVLEVMGRDAGWLGLACALPQYFFGTGPDYVYLPESGFSLDNLLSDAENALRRKNNVFISVSEGAIKAQNGKTDAFGHRDNGGSGRIVSQAIKDRLGCKSRSVELSLPQRCGAHFLSLTDIKESRRIGKAAVDVALLGKTGIMLAYVRRQGKYGVDIATVNACDVANKTKKVPLEFINSKGNFITDKGVEYLSPLIKGEIKLKYKMGIPHFFRIEGELCTK